MQKFRANLSILRNELHLGHVCIQSTTRSNENCLHFHSTNFFLVPKNFLSVQCHIEKQNTKLYLHLLLSYFFLMSGKDDVTKFSKEHLVVET